MREARSRAMNDAAKLDRHLHIMRISSYEVPGNHLLKLSDQPDSNALVISGPTLSDAVAVYLR